MSASIAQFDAALGVGDMTNRDQASPTGRVTRPRRRRRFSRAIVWRRALRVIGHGSRRTGNAGSGDFQDAHRDQLVYPLIGQPEEPPGNRPGVLAERGSGVITGLVMAEP